MANRLQELLPSRPLIAPSMLKCDFGNLHREFVLLEQAGFPLLHLDVMDGHFVPNLSYGPMVIERMRELTSLPLDAHLMISDPAKYLDDYLRAGCDAITFHIEAVPEPVELLNRIREENCLAGLAINPGTPVEAIEAFLPLCNMILVMSVEPGFGGQKFMPIALDKLSHIKGLLRDGQLLSIDGGISVSTIGAVASAGADTFVCGSSIFNEPDYSEAHTDLKAAIETVTR